jgi:hypothetical protein
VGEDAAAEVVDEQVLTEGQPVAELAGLAAEQVGALQPQVRPLAQGRVGLDLFEHIALHEQAEAGQPVYRFPFAGVFGAEQGLDSIAFRENP